MKKRNAGLLIGALVIGVGAAGIAFQASAHPYYHGHGGKHHGGGHGGWCQYGAVDAYAGPEYSHRDDYVDHGEAGESDVDADASFLD